MRQMLIFIGLVAGLFLAAVVGYFAITGKLSILLLVVTVLLLVVGGIVFTIYSILNKKDVAQTFEVPQKKRRRNRRRNKNAAAAVAACGASEIGDKDAYLEALMDDKTAGPTFENLVFSHDYD